MKRFLGWDCANKSLAWSYIEIDTHIYSKLDILSNDIERLLDLYMGDGIVDRVVNGGADDGDILQWKETLQDPELVREVCDILFVVDYFLSNFIKYLGSGVENLLGDRKVRDTSDSFRASALHAFLTTHPLISTTAADFTGGTKVIIEHQPSKIGTKINSAATAVAMQLLFYYIRYEPILISPKLKNNLSLSDSLTLDHFTKGLKKNRYRACKNHSRENFIYLLSVFDLSHISDGILRKNMDDLADSTMQILAYTVKNKMFH